MSQRGGAVCKGLHIGAVGLQLQELEAVRALSHVAADEVSGCGLFAGKPD